MAMSTQRRSERKENHQGRGKGKRRISRAAAAHLLWDAEGLEQRILLAFTPTPVTRYHMDNQSNGVNSTETLLTPSTVNVNQFGKQFSTPVDGQVYAEPLYVPNLNITSGPQQGVHNVVFVATEHDTLYAIDAHGGNILWTRSFTDTTNGAVNPLGATAMKPVPSGGSIISSTDLTPEIGITATPVIDLASNSLYLVAKSQQTIGGNVNHFDQILYRINIQSGAVISSKVIGDTIYSGGNYTYVTSGAAADTPYSLGTGSGAITVSGQSRVYFNALREFGRVALMIYNGTIYMGFASHGDAGPYHGWMLAYDANTLALKGALDTTPNGGLGGIWQGGGSIVVDPQGNFYFETGNGSFNTSASNFGTNYSGLPKDADYGDAFVKVQLDPSTSPTNQNANGWGLKVVDFFSPFNNSALNGNDTDLGSGSPVILPDAVGSTAHPHLLIGAGKEGKLYLIDRDNMGGFNNTTDRVVQEQGSALTGLLNTPSFFMNNPNPAAPAKPSGTLLVVMGYGSGARAFNISNGAFSTTPTSQTTTDFGYLPGSPTVSADGITNGIMWAINRNTNKLYAYRADNLGIELWDSGMAPNSRDQLGTANKFTVPTVADGQVFVGTANSLVVYGPPVAPTAPPIAPGGLVATAPTYNQVKLTWADLSSNEDEFLIERTTTPNDPASWQQIDTVSANATTYTDTDVLAESTYYYRVRAYNSYLGGSYSAYTNVANATTPAAPPIGTGDGAFGQYFNDSGGVHLSGTPVLTRVDPEINFNWGSGSPGGSVGTDHFSVKWTGRIQAQLSETYTFYTLSDDGVRFMIKPAGAPTYTTLINNFTDHSPTTDTSPGYAMSGGAFYDFEMDYYENGGGAQAELSWSSPSTPLEHVPQSQLYSGVAPANPSNLSAVAASGTQVNLTWSDNSDIETGYVVERLDPGGVFQPIVTLPANTTSYMDSSLNPDTQYSYRVRATNFAANSGYSNSVSVTTPIPPAKPTNAHPTSVTTTQIAMAWTDVADNEDGYRISRATAGSDTFIVIAQLPPNSNSYLDTGFNGNGLAPGTEYEYHIQAYNVAGYNDFSGFRTATLTLAPTNLAAVAGDQSATLNWTAPSFTGEATLMTFNVYRSTSPDGSSATRVGTDLTDPTFTDTNLDPSQTYYYQVSAVDAGGESARSNIASVTPGSGLVIQGNGNGMIIIKSDGTNTLAWVDHDPSLGQPDYTAQTSTLSGLSIASQAGGEVIVIDYSGGFDPLPVSGLSITGGPNDTVILNGSSGNDVFALLNGSFGPSGMNSVTLGTNVSSIGVNGNGGNDSLSIAGSSTTISSDLGAGGGTMSLSLDQASTVGFAASQNLASLTISGQSQATLLPGHNKVLEAGTLNIGDISVLDLTDNDMILPYVDASPEAQVQQWVSNWQNDQAGPLLMASSSSDGSSPFLRTLAVSDNADLKFSSFDGHTFAPGDFNQVLLKYTYLGDANLDGQVTPQDYAIVDGNIGRGHDWGTGDVNEDGVVNPGDYAQIDGNIGAGNGSPEGGPQLGPIVAPGLAAAMPDSSEAGAAPSDDGGQVIQLAVARPEVIGQAVSPFSTSLIRHDSGVLDLGLADVLA